MQQYDAIIIGGGAGGLTVACGLAQAGLQVACVDPNLPVLPMKASNNDYSKDPRTIALMRSALKILGQLGIWPFEENASCTPLKHLRLIDDQAGEKQGANVCFSSSEMGQEEFGWNIPLPLLLTKLFNQADKLGVSFIVGKLQHFRAHEKWGEITLNSGETYKAPVILGADGRDSRLRKAAGISTISWNYPQVALACSFTHEKPHENTSIEFHRPWGPLTTVPLAGNRSGLVWMVHETRREVLLNDKPVNFAKTLQAEMHSELGEISEISKRGAFAMQGKIARKFGAKRALLIGEAAHAMPPIGAQGLNLTLHDAQAVITLIANAHKRGEDLGAEKLLHAYHLQRSKAVAVRQLVVHGMNISLISSSGMPSILHTLGLNALNQVPYLRKKTMQMGMNFAW